MGFLDNYEASRERLERWLATYPNGRIETRIVEFNAEKGYVLVEARAFKGKLHETDCHICHGLVEAPAGIDYAYGYQAAYQPNMRRWFVEDTTTSAIMRVQQLVMGGAERTVREVMEQVENTPAKIANADKDHDYWTTKFGDVPSYATAEAAEQSGIPSLGSSMDEIKKQLGGELVAEAPQCRHGHRVWRTGTAKTGKNWANYSCVGRKPDQCEPVWYVFTSDGTWKPQL